MRTLKYEYHSTVMEEIDKSERYDKVCEVFALNEQTLNKRPILNSIELDVGGIMYITGYSGAGKSTLLRMIQRDLSEEDIEEPKAPEKVDIPIIDLLGKDLKEAIKLLGWVGLGESYLYLLPYNALSEGQKTRFQLALSLNQKPNVILVDEFLSNLDRITAKVVAYSFQKTCRKLGISAIVATAHDDLTEALAPDTQVTLDLNGAYQVLKYPLEKAFLNGLHNLEIRQGSLDDYDQLKRFHYFGDVDFAADGYDMEIYATHYEDTCIGVSVLVSPYPKDWNVVHYFREVNERVKSIARLVVHPSFRGAGLSIPLMRPSLSKLAFIETRSALGLYMPIYLAAGYRSVEVATNTVSDRRQMLWDRLWDLGIDPLSFLDKEKGVQSLETIAGKAPDDLLPLALEVMVEMLVKDYLYFRENIDLQPLTDQQHQEIREIFMDACDELPLDYMLYETAYFRMQGFVVKHYGVQE